MTEEEKRIAQDEIERTAARLDDPQDELRKYIDDYAGKSFDPKDLERMEAAYINAVRNGSRGPTPQQGEQEPMTEAERIIFDIQLLHFKLDYLKDPEKALSLYAPEDMRPGYLEDFQKSEFERLLARAAKKTGADPEQIANKETRTREQQHELTQAAIAAQIHRMEIMVKSRYMQAFTMLSMSLTNGVPLSSRSRWNPEEFANSLEYIIQESAVSYFFGIHPEIEPILNSDPLTPEQQEEIQAIYSKIKAFFDARIDTSGTPQTRKETLELFMQFINAEHPAAESSEAESLEKIIAKIPESVMYPLDKPNSGIWNLIEMPANGQLRIDFDTTKEEDKKSGKSALVLYGLTFDDLPPEIAKKLTYYDKRVYVAVAGLHAAGNNRMSASQIFRAMGNKGNPSPEQIQKVNDSLTKMGAARIYLNNAKETETYSKYPKFSYDASLLPFERVKVYINNTLTESAIHLFREPPLITFARERGQITQLTPQLLESPINKTEANLQLEDYLLERIGRMKNPKTNAQKKILFSTVYEKCRITTTKQKQRAPDKIKRYLDHYKACGWIADYTMEKDGVTIQTAP